MAFGVINDDDDDGDDWVKTKHLPHALAAAPGSSWSIVHLYGAYENASTEKASTNVQRRTV